MIARGQILERAWVNGIIIFDRVDTNPTQNVQVQVRTRSGWIYSSSQISKYSFRSGQIGSSTDRPIFFWPKLHPNDIRVHSGKNRRSKSNLVLDRVQLLNPTQSTSFKYRLSQVQASWDHVESQVDPTNSWFKYLMTRGKMSRR